MCVTKYIIKVNNLHINDNEFLTVYTNIEMTLWPLIPTKLNIPHIWSDSTPPQGIASPRSVRAPPREWSTRRIVAGPTSDTAGLLCRSYSTKRKEPVMS